jgi:hypothetical protein
MTPTKSESDGDNDPAFPPVGIHFAGALGAQLVVVEAEILTPDDAIEYAKAIFAAAAAACRQARLDAAGHG